jgi:hypothetical protein
MAARRWDNLAEKEPAGDSAAIERRISWGELGCPRDIGLYKSCGSHIRVKKIHIIVAENDPSALFTVVALRPPLGPPEFVLGHRVA